MRNLRRTARGSEVGFESGEGEGREGKEPLLRFQSWKHCAYNGTADQGPRCSGRESFVQEPRLDSNGLSYVQEGV